MTTVYDPKTGQPIDLDTPDAEQKILAGAVALKKSDTFNLIDSKGKWAGAVPASRLTDYLGSGQFHLTTPDQKAQIEKIGEGLGTGGAIKVGAEKALNELSFGVSEPIIKNFRSPEEQSTAEQLAELHPTASAVGTGLGFAGSLVAGEPLFKGAEKVGKLAQTGVEAGLGTGKLASTLGSAAKYGAESTVLAAPQAVTEASLGDPNEAAEHLAYALGAGVALGTVNPLIKGGTKLVGNIIGKPFGIDFNAVNPLKKMTDDQTIRAGIYGTDKHARELVDQIGTDKMAEFLHGNGLVRQPGEDFEQYLPRVQQYKQQIGAEIGAAYDQIANVPGNPVEDISNRIKKEVIDPLRRIGAKKNEVRALDNYLNDFQEAADYINKDKISAAEAKIGVPPEESILRDTTTDQKPAFLPTDMNGTIKELPPFQPVGDTVNNQFEGEATIKSGPPLNENQAATVKPGEINQKLVTEEVPSVKTVQEAPKVTAPPEEVSSVFSKKSDVFKEDNVPNVISLGDLWEERKALDDRIYNEKRAVLGNPSPLHAQLQKVRNIIDDEIKKKAEEALGEAGGEFIKPISKLNEAYRNISTWEDVVERSHSAEASRRNISLSDYLSGIAAGAHNPLGLVGGIAGGLVHKYLRENGNAIIAKYGNNLSLYVADQARMKSQEELDKIPKILKAMSNGVSRAPVTAASQAENVFDHFTGSKSKNEQESFNNFSYQLSKAVSDPTNQKAQQIAQFLSKGAPNIGAQYVMQNQKMLNYLYQQMPKNPYMGMPFVAQNWKPTKSQMKAYRDKLGIILDPYSVMHHVDKGTINRDHMDALKTIYPANYNSLVGKIKEYGFSNPKMPYQQKLKLSMLIGENLDPSLNNVGSYQEAYSQQSPPAKPLAKGKLEKLPGAQYNDLQEVVG